MKYKSIFLLFFSYFSNFIYSQSFSPLNIQWQKSFGGSASEAAKSIVQIPDGGYIAAGFTTSADGNVIINRENTDF